MAATASFRLSPIQLDEDVIIGDATGQRYKTGPGNDFLAGMEGHDHLFGGEGSDIFAYITQPSIFDKDVIVDFHQLLDDKIGFAREIYGAAVGANGAPRLQIGVEAVGQQATFVEDPRSYTLYFDPDGAGSIPKIPIAYLPYWILKPADLIWLDQPIAGQSVGRINSTWAPQASGDFSGDGNTDLIWQDLGWQAERLVDARRQARRDLRAPQAVRLGTAGDRGFQRR